MAKFKPEDIRNIVFAGHGGTGKTTLVDEILCAAGVTNRVGSVKDGSSIVDVADDEIEARASIDLHMHYCNFAGKHFQVLDTPGRSDFVGQYFMALKAADTVVIAVDAYTGIQVNTRKVWKIAKEEGKAVAFVVTKLDLDNVNLNKVLHSLRDTFGAQVVPLYVPDTTGPGISKLVPVLTGDGGMAAEYQGALSDAIAESDEELMMRYLDGDVAPAELANHVGTAVAKGSLVPVLMYAQKGSLGVKDLLNTIAVCYPSATLETVNVVSKTTDEAGLEVVTSAPKAAEPNTFLAQVVRVVVDEHKGRMSVMRVFTGQNVAGGTFYNVSKGQQGKFGKLFKFQGGKQDEVDNVGAGELFAAVKVDGLDMGDTISDGTWKVELAPQRYPVPMVAMAVKPKTREDESRMSQILQRFALEDPCFKTDVDRQTKEMLIYGISELHLNVLLARMSRRHRVNVDMRLPRISYRETITREVSDYHRHKKQSGGSGEFAEVHFRMRPYTKGDKDFSFVDALHGDNVRRQFVPSVEKGCRYMMEHGVLTGSPCIRVEVDFFDGKDHPVDGKDSAFQKAARECFKKCFLAAGAALMEPVVNLEVTIPTEFAGDISQYLNSHRGRIQGMEMMGDEQMIRAVVPLAEAQTFSSDLRSMTQGQGSYEMAPAGYEQVPGQVQAQVVEKFKAEFKEEE